MAKEHEKGYLEGEAQSGVVCDKLATRKLVAPRKLASIVVLLVE